MSGFLFAFGYPAAIVVICRWVAVVRERRLIWLTVHHLGVGAIVVGWVLLHRWVAVAINSMWLISSTLWFLSRWIPARYVKEQE